LKALTSRLVMFQLFPSRSIGEKMIHIGSDSFPAASVPTPPECRPAIRSGPFSVCLNAFPGLQSVLSPTFCSCPIIASFGGVVGFGWCVCFFWVISPLAMFFWVMRVNLSMTLFLWRVILFAADFLVWKLVILSFFFRPPSFRPSGR